MKKHERLRSGSRQLNQMMNDIREVLAILVGLLKQAQDGVFLSRCGVISEINVPGCTLGPYFQICCSDGKIFFVFARVKDERGTCKTISSNVWDVANDLDRKSIVVLHSQLDPLICTVGLAVPAIKEDLEIIMSHALEAETA